MILYCPNWMGQSANEDDTDYIRSSITAALVLLVTVVIFVKKLVSLYSYIRYDYTLHTSILP